MRLWVGCLVIVPLFPVCFTAYFTEQYIVLVSLSTTMAAPRGPRFIFRGSGPVVPTPTFLGFSTFVCLFVFAYLSCQPFFSCLASLSLFFFLELLHPSTTTTNHLLVLRMLRDKPSTADGEIKTCS